MRRLGLVTAFRIRRAAWPEFSGRETLAADSIPELQSWGGLFDGCPIFRNDVLVVENNVEK
jgi:hypothetical protein